MRRLYCDFNDHTGENEYWILTYDGMPVGDDLLEVGEKVILFQDADDFEVEAVIAFKFIGELAKSCFVAIPDWASIRDI